MPSDTVRLEARTESKHAGAPGKDAFIGFFIDGKSLREILHTGNITGIGWGPAEEQRKYLEPLMGMRATELPSGRLPLYLCAECGDLGCGAITFELAKENGKVVWKNFGFENNYEEDVKCLEEYSDVGPFEFPDKEYADIMAALLTLISRQ